MKKIILVVAVVFATVSCKKEVNNKVEVSEVMAVNRTLVKPLTVDVENSIVNWRGFKPTGEHSGTIGISEGAISLEEGKLVGGSFTFDMDAIVNTDMEADSEYNAKLVGHLKSADFFDVEKYPTAKFKITEVKEVAGKLNVSGNLTIKDATKNITFPASLSSDKGATIFTSEVFTINRADFNVKYGSKSFFNDLKDKFINDDFEISFVVKTKK